DRSLVAESLDSLSPGEGTALGDAVALSRQMGRKQRTSDGIVPPLAILVISDGARDGGRIAPQTASAEARKQGVPVYAILVGTDNGVLQERLTGGLVRYTRVPPSPQTLSQLAQVSRGELFTAPDDKRLAGGLDATLSQRAIDVTFIGTLGSPVNPGVSTSRAVVFVASYVGGTASSASFRPHVGCMPSSGGGSRVPTALGAILAGHPTVR